MITLYQVKREKANTYNLLRLYVLSIGALTVKTAYKQRIVNFSCSLDDYTEARECAGMNGIFNFYLKLFASANCCLYSNGVIPIFFLYSLKKLE